MKSVEDCILLELKEFGSAELVTEYPQKVLEYLFDKYGIKCIFEKTGEDKFNFTVVIKN